MKNRHYTTSLLFLVWAIIIVIGLVNCSPRDQALLQTQVYLAGKTAVAKAKTDSPPLQTQLAQAAQTAASQGKVIAETQAASLKKTAMAQMPAVGNTTPSPWDISWIPPAPETVVNNINAILDNTGMAGQGETILNSAQQYGVNPAFALAMFWKEANFSSPGTRAYKNNNPGNIIATGDCRNKPQGATCSGVYGEISRDSRFGIYESMSDGVRAYFKLLAREYKPGTTRNCSDIKCIITVYCPPADNCDVSQYVSQVTELTRKYQNQISAP